MKIISPNIIFFIILVISNIAVANTINLQSDKISWLTKDSMVMSGNIKISTSNFDIHCDNTTFTIESFADSTLTYDNIKNIKMTGNIYFKSKDYEIKSHSAEIKIDKNVIIFKGNVSILHDEYLVNTQVFSYDIGTLKHIKNTNESTETKQKQPLKKN